MIPGHPSGRISLSLSLSLSLSQLQSLSTSQLFVRCTYRESQLCFSTCSVRHSDSPSTAPKPKANVNHILRNQTLHYKNCIDRNHPSLKSYPAFIAELVKESTALKNDPNLKQLQREARKLQETFKENPKDGKDDTSESFEHPSTRADNREDHDAPNVQKERARQLKQQLRDLKHRQQFLVTKIKELALELPNTTSSNTPIGKDPRLISYINANISPSQASKSHVDIGTELDIVDFTSSRTTSGWGWYYLKNTAVLLEQALIQYALYTASRHGFTLVSPPSVVYSHISDACGFRPRDHNGETQVYTLAQQEVKEPDPSDVGLHGKKPELCLTGTAEIPFAAMKANISIPLSDLPLRIIGASRCYRAEAGGRGVDTKGLYRVHEFTKVEMFAWTQPSLSNVTEVFDTMLLIQTSILEALGLRCRVLEMPSRDLGASAIRKVDIEAYFPSRKLRDEGWGEVTSTSICTDYQTRRLATRLGGSKHETAKGFPFTVNGTAVAIPRVLAAILENGWVEEKGGVAVPECLWPWMGGVEFIKKPLGKAEREEEGTSEEKETLGAEHPLPT